MPKFTMPKTSEFQNYFLAKKAMYEAKKDPVWVYLEREMQENIEKKPYNEKVGDWLKFLKDLKRFYHLRSKKEMQMLVNDIGPLWYTEMSGMQKDVLRRLIQDIHHDLIEDLPNRTRKALSDLGITRTIPKAILMKVMMEAGEDAALFIWALYTALYKKPPSEPRGEYDMDARILMSALVFIDKEECLEKLEALTKPAKETPAPEKKKKEKMNYEPKCQYGMYLQRTRIPVYCKNPTSLRQRINRPPPRPEKKISIRSDSSYERLRIDDSFLERRLERCKKARKLERICTYKFWEPPVYLRNTDPHMADYCQKLKLLKKKAKVGHMSEYENIQFNVGPVAFVGGSPRYLLNNISTLPTGYIPIHGGIRLLQPAEYLTVISGAWRYPIEKDENCDKTCACLEKWDSSVMNYLEESKCTCGHLYDFYHEGKSKEKYFHPPEKHSPMWFDYAKIFQMDPMEDFIKDTVKFAEMSEEPSPIPSRPGLSTGGVSMKALLQSLLAELSDTALVIPHLPQAHHLNSLLEWVRNRFKGKLTPAEHRHSMLKSLRRWLWLKHIDFRARAYRIAFSIQETHNMTWKYRQNLQFLFETLLRDFTTRNRLNQLEQTRLWWSTMDFDRFPSQAFLDVYFTYMPGRMKDTYVLNPFNAERTPKDIFKTCPL